MKKAKSQRKKGDLKAAMNAIRQEKSERQRSDRARAVARKSKREERAKVAAGKSPFFLKVCEQRGGGEWRERERLREREREARFTLLP